MFILGIESTAHTFGVGVVEGPPLRVLSNARHTYVPPSGGMKPSDVAKHHVEVAPGIVREGLDRAGVSIGEIDAIAIALGPGLGPALRVGATVARALAYRYGKPLVPVNHGIGHIEIGKFTTGAKDPLVVYISGGNTMLVTLRDGRYRVFGETLDMSLGNMMDVFVREAGLSPPYILKGKHMIDICAEDHHRLIDLPYVVKGQDLSYSGLLTASLNALKKHKLSDVCASLREVAFDMLVEATERAISLTGKSDFLVVGGVAASGSLKEKYERMAESRGSKFHLVPQEFAGDNGAMIAMAGFHAYKSGVSIPISESRVRPLWRVDEVDILWKS